MTIMRPTKRGAWHLHVIFMLVLIVHGFGLCLPAQGKSELAGTTSANFLKVGTQAKAMGFGEAVTSLADGIAYIGYNPASVKINGLTLTASHTTLYEGVNLEDIGIGLAFGDKGGMYVRGNGVMFDKTERTDPNGNILGTYSASSYSAGLGFYVRGGPLTFGAFGKTIQQNISGFKASTVAADVGIRYLTPLPGVSLGVSVLNVGRPVKFVVQEDELPRAIRAGIGYDYGFFRLGLDAVQYNDQAVFLSAGAEVTIFGGLSFRAGYSDRSELSSPFKAGLGFRFTSLELDYAYNPGDAFGASHRVSLTIR